MSIERIATLQALADTAENMDEYLMYSEEAKALENHQRFQGPGLSAEDLAEIERRRLEMVSIYELEAKGESV